MSRILNLKANREETIAKYQGFLDKVRNEVRAGREINIGDLCSKMKIGPMAGTILRRSFLNKVGKILVFKSDQGILSLTGERLLSLANAEGRESRRKRAEERKQIRKQIKEQKQMEERIKATKTFTVPISLGKNARLQWTSAEDELLLLSPSTEYFALMRGRTKGQCASRMSVLTKMGKKGVKKGKYRPDCYTKKGLECAKLIKEMAKKLGVQVSMAGLNKKWGITPSSSNGKTIILQDHVVTAPTGKKSNFDKFDKLPEAAKVDIYKLLKKKYNLVPEEYGITNPYTNLSQAELAEKLLLLMD